MNGYTPDAGDIVWLEFSPHAGSETAGRHPAVVLTRREYSVATGLALVVPVTSKVKGGSFEVPVHGPRKINGVALANEVRTVDYMARKAEKRDTCPPDVLRRIRDIAQAVIEGA